MAIKAELAQGRMQSVLRMLKATIEGPDFLESNTASLMFLVRLVDGEVSSILEQARLSEGNQEQGNIFGFSDEELAKLESTFLFMLAQMKLVPENQDPTPRIRIKSALMRSNWRTKFFHIENRAIMEKALQFAEGSVEMVVQMANELERDKKLKRGSTKNLREAYAELEKHEKVKRESVEYVFKKVKAMVLATQRPLEAILADEKDRKEVTIAALKQLLDEFSA
jgi:hypothetical protein